MLQPITLAGFAGSIQAQNARLLADGICASILDADPRRPGVLTPLADRLTVATVPTSPQRLTIRRMGRDIVNDATYWLGWTTHVHAELMPGTNAVERTIFTGSGTPKWTATDIGLSGGPPYPQGTREFGVPVPTGAPTLSLISDGTGTASTRYYVETFVNDMGWESAPSPVSGGLDCKPGAHVDVTLHSIPPGGSYGFTLRRVYRTDPDNAGGADFFLLAEVAIGTTLIHDTGQSLGGTLATEGMLPPPADGFGLCKLWNGMYAMLSGKTLCLSDTVFFYAYPLKFQKALTDTPLALARWGENVLVLTTAAPVHFYGNDPLGMVDRPPGLPQALRSVMGVVTFDHGVVWPSNEGLAYYGNAGQALVTTGIITPDQWKAMQPDTMVAARWGRYYVCSFAGTSPAGAGHAFIIDPLNPTGVWYLSTGFDAAYYDPLADALFLLEGGNVRKFAAANTKLTAKAVSRKNQQPKPVNYGWLKVEADTYPVTVKVTADGTTRTYTAADNLAFALDNDFTAFQWQLEADVAAGDVEAARLGRTAGQLKGGA